MNDERVIAVLNGLTSLIVSHAKMTAREMYAPGPSSDDSDEAIAEHQKWVSRLREIRRQLEDLVTGLA